MRSIFTCFVILFACLNTNLLFAQAENAVSFDNVDDYITAPAASSLIAGSSNISMAFWVLGSNTAPVYPDYDGFAGFRNNNDADFYILQLTANGLEARFRNSTGINYDITFGGFQTGTPQHLALTYDGSTLTLYHNGNPAGSTAASGNIANPGESFYMGMLPWTGANFFTNGRLDEISLWNKTLTPAEVNCIYEGAINANENGLLLYYKCNQGISGGNNASILNLTDSKSNINGIFNNLSLTGNTSNFVNGVITGNSSTVTDSICSGGVYVFGSQTLTAPGIYFESFPGTGGCDSVVTLNLIASGAGINSTVTQNGVTLTAQQSGAAYQWINCTTGNTPIPGETNQSFTATANGQYAVVITLNGCTDTSACQNITSVGINDPMNDQITIAVSNPFTDEIVITQSPDSKDFDFSITDATGREIVKSIIPGSGSIRITTANWPSGVYLLSQTQGPYRKKLIKNK